MKRIKDYLAAILALLMLTLLLPMTALAAEESDPNLGRNSSLAGDDTAVYVEKYTSVLPEQSSTVQNPKKVDIVFIIDSTGSMSDKIDNVINNLNDFTQILNSAGLDFRIAIVEYKDIVEDGNDSTKILQNSGTTWFTAVEQIQLVLSDIYVDGGGDTPETVLDALGCTISLDFRVNASKFAFLLTDADYKTDNNYGYTDMAEAIAALQTEGIAVSVISDINYQSTYSTLYTDTDGIFCNIYGDFSEELGTLAEYVKEVAESSDIITDIVADGIKYVPYSSLLQTNITSGTAKFSLVSGKLPDGLTLKEDGEIYGIPTETGKYMFTVKATYSDESQAASSKEFTMTISENTDANVEAANDGAQGYKLLDAVERELDVKTIPEEGMVFRSEGPFEQFVDFYIDSDKLERDVDYIAEEGSTKITIRAQTFKNAGNGTHTLAAEFRVGGDEDGVLKRTVQNVTISGVSNTSRHRGTTITVYAEMPTVRVGAQSEAVKTLQTMLNALGYDCGTVDGIFGQKTHAAVVAFQKAMGISVDGIVGPQTWGKLRGTGIASVVVVPSAAASAVNMTISSNMPLITAGSSGDAVKTLQARLIELGYDCGKVDGIFGEKAEAAVRAYQKANALRIDGMVGEKTWGALR